ncbi:hypothetical protein AB0H20_19170 [Nocardia fluminea]|uniref:hypothetical protein n=1 Tax=Nocardia fluminea TaxID=134984 RepID=UPI0033C42E27
MHASKRATSVTQAHLALPPATPITLHPSAFAIWPAMDPVAPAAPDTSTVSPAEGLPISIMPSKASHRASVRAPAIRGVRAAYGHGTVGS